MTTTPHGQVPEALTYERDRAIMEGERNASLDAYSRVVLLTSAESRLYEAAFTNGWDRCATHVQNPAESEHVAGDVSKNSAKKNMNDYAELPEPDATTVGLGAVWNRHSMRDFADATHALRAQQPAPAGDWLWCKLMDFCKKRGFAPANFNDLFEIVAAARATAGSVTAPAGATSNTHWNQAPCAHCGCTEGQHFNARCHHIQGETRYTPTAQPAPAGATPECLTCSDHGAVGNILTAEPCPDCTRLNAQPAPATQQAGDEE